MTRPTSEVPFPPDAPEGDPAPFDHAHTLPLTQVVNLAQLADEIEKATGQEVHLAVSGGAEFDADVAPTAEDNVTLSVSPGTVSAAKVATVLAAHEPVSDYGVPQSEKDFAELLVEVGATEDMHLSPEEMQVALLGLLRRVNSAPSRGAQRLG